MGKFIIKNITDLRNAKLGDEIPESDYSILGFEDKFVQMEYVEESEDKIEKMDVFPGLFTINKTNSNIINSPIIS